MALKMTARLKSVEVELLSPSRGPTGVTLFWHDEVEPCLDHSRCHVEVATGVHHHDVVVLSWERGE